MAGRWFSRRRVGRIQASLERLPGIGLILLVPVLAAPGGAAAQEESPVFTFSVSCPGEIRSAPGKTFQRDIDVILDPTENPGDVGAQGWTFRLVSEGVRIVSISTKGTLPEELVGCSGESILPGKCPGIINELGTCNERTAASSAVALSLTRPVTLPPVEPTLVARIRIEGEAPETPNETAAAKLEFVGDCEGGGNLSNFVTWKGRTLAPLLESCALTIVASEPVFRRGEVNGDGQVDISDAIYLLGCTFRGTACPTCWDAADANDDGEPDVSDAIVILGYIFLASLPPPFPGPIACGFDQTPDELPACEGTCNP